MQDLLRLWNEEFYTPVILDIILIIALFITFKKRKKFKELKYIPFYIIFLLLTSAIQIGSETSEDFANHHFFVGLETYTDYFFTLAEMIIFSHLYYQLLSNKIFKKTIIIGNIFFLLFFIYMAITDKKFYQAISGQTQSIVYTVESIILLILCIFYFIELFKKMSILNLKNDPTFWVSTGLSFFMACTLPYSLLENYILNNFPNLYGSSYSIFYVFYSLFFLMIIRAYLCKPQKTI